MPAHPRLTTPLATTINRQNEEEMAGPQAVPVLFKRQSLRAPTFEELAVVNCSVISVMCATTTDDSA